MTGKCCSTYTSLSLEEKIRIIELSEKNINVKELCEKFKCGKTQVYNALKRKRELREEWLQGATYKKRKRKAENEDIDALVWTWFVDAQSKNLPVSGPILQAKAKEIAQSLNKNDFKASNGWLVSFRKRHNISCQQFSREARSVRDFVTWHEKLSDIIQGYAMKDIFNCNETGLFFRALPAKSLVLNSEKCVGGEDSKERLTVFLCCSMTGELEKPLVIGRTETPRCFKNLDIKHLPVVWKSNEKAWMTANIMQDWLHYFNNKMKLQNRNVLLFMDNAVSLPHIQQSHVDVVVFPSNAACVIQPLDQGIIYRMKLKYRQFLLQSLIANANTCSCVSQLSKSITVLDAVNWISKACKEILPTTITKCFKKAGFSAGNSDEQLEDIIDHKELERMIRETGMDGISAMDYVNMDSQLYTKAGIQTPSNLMEIHNEESGSDEENEITVENPVKTYKDALVYIQYLHNFSVQANNCRLMDMLNDIRCETEKCVLQDEMKQTTLLDYWKK